MMKASNSEIQTFKGCQRRWWLSYLLRLAPLREKDGEVRPIPTSLFVGSIVHAGVEVYRLLRMRGYDHERCIEDALSAARKYYDDEQARTPEGAEPLYSELKTWDLARIMLEGYFEWLQTDGEDSVYEYIAVEEVYEAPLTPTVTITGKIDAVVRDLRTGELTVIDTKTCQSLETLPELMQIDEQLLTYDWLVSRVFGERVRHVVFDMLRKVKRTASAKPPFYGRDEEHHNDRQLKTFEQRLKRTTAQMQDLAEITEGLPMEEAAQLAIPSPSSQCSWSCPHVAVCPMFNDGSDAVRFIEDNYEKVDPYEYYESKT